MDNPFKRMKAALRGLQLLDSASQTAFNEIYPKDGTIPTATTDLKSMMEEGNLLTETYKEEAKMIHSLVSRSTTLTYETVSDQDIEDLLVKNQVRH